METISQEDEIDFAASVQFGNLCYTVAGYADWHDDGEENDLPAYVYAAEYAHDVEDEDDEDESSSSTHTPSYRQSVDMSSPSTPASTPTRNVVHDRHLTRSNLTDEEKLMLVMDRLDKKVPTEDDRRQIMEHALTWTFRCHSDVQVHCEWWTVMAQDETGPH